MPNWCENKLAVHGNTDDVKKFIDDVKTDALELSFEAHLPTPDQSKFEGRLTREQQADPDYWYNWNVNNWGTKWDVGDESFVDVVVNDDKSTAIYNFETAWAPPELWLRHVAPLYPTLSFKMEYAEQGMGFAGILGFHKGNEVEDKEWDYYSSSDVDSYEDMYG